MSGAFDPYHRWLGIPPKDQPANHYRMLGIELFEGDPGGDPRRGRAADGPRARRTNWAQYVELSQRILNELATAKACLLKAEDKTAYDHALRQELSPQKTVVPSMPPAAPAMPLSAGKRVSILHNSLHVVAVVVLVTLAILSWMLYRQWRAELAETATESGCCAFGCGKSVPEGG